MGCPELMCSATTAFRTVARRWLRGPPDCVDEEFVGSPDPDEPVSRIGAPLGASGAHPVEGDPLPLEDFASLGTVS